jgi:hypothetical protein
LHLHEVINFYTRARNFAQPSNHHGGSPQVRN